MSDPVATIPMTHTGGLIEPSFADAIAIIAAAQELPEQKRRHWTTSLRQIARLLDKPLELIPARYSAVRADVAQLHHVPAGLTAKTLANHRSNTKTALLWLAREKGLPEHGAPLTHPWEELRAKIDDRLIRSRLSSLMRFCSANNIVPTEVDEAIIDRFIEYRSRAGKPADSAFRRLLARAWNSNVNGLQSWSVLKLTEPAIKANAEVAWEDFPEGFRKDVDRYLDSLNRARRSRAGQRIRPLRFSTIRTRRAELAAAARMAVKVGMPIGELTSLSALLAPEVAEKVLDAYWHQNGDTPKAFTIDLACRFVAIAKETKWIDEAGCERLDEMRQDLEDHRGEGFTDRNRAFIRQVLTSGVWTRVVNLPAEMMAAARAEQAYAPVRSAVTAQLAVAIAILSVAPVRLANLTAIKIGFNLIKPNGPDSNYSLAFPDYDVKNCVKLEYPLPPCVTQLIDEYVDDFRLTLLRGRNEDWLFPGQRSGAKGKISFSGQITERIYKGTGLQMTVHQFRHAAGALVLQQHPGNYELVRRLLGHRNVQTTINSYIGLENIQASEIYSEIVLQHMGDGLEAAE